MNRRVKWLFGGGVVFFSTLLILVYGFLRPAMEQSLQPLLMKEAEEQVNGTLDWESFSVSPLLDLEFREVSLKDMKGDAVLEVPLLTIDWSAHGVYSYMVGQSGPVKLVKRITASDPHIWVRKRENDEWNVQNLLKENREQTEGSFTGKVQVRGGQITVIPSAEEVYELESVDGIFVWDDAEEMAGKLSASILGNPFFGTVRYRDSEDFGGEFQASEVSLPSVSHGFKKYTEGLQELQVHEGLATLSKVAFSKEDGHFFYTVEGAMKDLSLTYDNVRVDEGSLEFLVTDTFAKVSELNVGLNGGTVSGNLQIDSLGEENLLSGEIHAKNVDGKDLFPAQEVAGVLSASLIIGGTWTVPKLVGQVGIEDGVYQKMIVNKGTMDVSYDNHVLEFPFVQAEALGGYVSGSGHYDATSGVGKWDLQADGIDISSLPLADSIQGRLSGAIHGDAFYREGEFSLVDMSFTGEGEYISYDGYFAERLSAVATFRDGGWFSIVSGMNLSAQGVCFDTLTGTISGKGDMINLSPMVATLDDGTVEVVGTVREQILDLHITGQDVNMNVLTPLTGESIAGTASFEGMITGDVGDPNVDLRIQGRNGSLREVAFGSLTGRIQWTDHRAYLENLRWTSSDGEYVISGQLGFEEQAPLELSVRMSQSRIEKLIALSGMDYPLTGWMDSEMSITGTRNNPLVKGNVHLWDGSFGDELFQSISMEYAYDKGVLTVDNGLAYVYNGTAVLNGTVSAESIQLYLELFDVDVHEIFPQEDFQGTVTFHGHARGSLKKPVLDGILFSPCLMRQDVRLDTISTNVHYENGTISLSAGTFTQGEGSFRWSGLYNSQSGTVESDLDFQDWNIRSIAKMFELPAEEMDGIVSGRMTLRGTLLSPDIIFSAKIQSGHLGSMPMGYGDLDFSYTGGKLDIRKAHIQLGDGVLAAKGTMEKDGVLDMQVAANSVEIGWIPEVLGKENITIGGKMTALIAVSGTKTDPLADVSIGIEKPQYGTVQFDKFSLMGNINNRIVDIKQCLLSKDIYKTSLKGTMPVNIITREDHPGTVPLDLSINLDKADLNIWALFSEVITEGKGPIKGQLKVVGDWRDPELNGTISVRDGEVTLVSMKEPIYPFDMQVILSGEKATAEGMGKVGGGDVKLKGRAQWKRGGLVDYDGELHIHAPKIKSDYYEGALDTDLTLAEIDGNPGIKGEIFMHDVKMDIPFALLSREGDTPPPLSLDVGIHIDEKVRLYNSALYDLWLKGHVEIKGPVSSPLATGRVNVEKGKIKVNATEFKIEEGHALWGAVPNSYLPMIHVDATTKVGRYKINAELDGPPGSIVTNFRSEPRLDDSQILMLLTLRQNPKSAEAMQGALFNAGLTMLFGAGIQDVLADTIGLDLISITSSLTDYHDSTEATQNNYYYIKIGKYIFDDFMLTATTGVNNERKSIGFHYDLKSHMGISSWYNNEHDSYWGLDWKFKF